MSNESHAKLMAFLESDEGKEDLRSYFSELDRKEKLIKDHFETDKFFDELNNIREWMLKNNINTISDEDFLFPKNLPLPIFDEVFDRLTNCILKSLESEQKCDDSKMFSNGYVDYKEWRVTWISGQGTVTTLILYRDRLRDGIISSIID
jgi:hypothetical protein